MTKNNLPWRVLVVEDDLLEIKAMRKALEFVGLSYDIAESANDARNFMRERHYHLLSLDQQIPEIVGDLTVMTSGAELDSESRRVAPLASKVFYTAQMPLDHAFTEDVKNATLLAGRLAAPIWHKSSSDDPDSSKYTPPGWAQALDQHLRQRYLIHYLRYGSDLLPTPLARCCVDLRNKLCLSAQDDQDNPTLKISVDNCPYVAEQWLRFYEVTLLLAVAQAHNWTKGEPWLPLSANAGSLATQLKYYLDKGAGTEELKAWQRYIASGDDSQPLLLLQEHGQRLDWLQASAEGGCDWEEHKFLQLMLPVLAIAEYWATRPLLTRVQPISVGRYQAKRISSAGWPWPRAEFDCQLGADGFVPDPDAVYLCLPVPGSSSKKLQKLSPWLHLHTNTDNNTQQLQACLRPDPQVSGNWLCYNFDDGSLASWTPSSTAQQQLQKSWH